MRKGIFDDALYGGGGGGCTLVAYLPLYKDETRELAAEFRRFCAI